MTDSMTAKGWVQKSNFNEVDQDPTTQAKVHADTTRHHARLFTDAEIEGYSQWFAWKLKLKNAAAAVSWIGTRTTKNSPQHPSPLSTTDADAFQDISAAQQDQIFADFATTALTREQAVTGGTNEEKPMHGPDGKSTASQLDAKTSSWTASASKSKCSYSEHLPWLSGVGDSLMCDSTHWLKA